MTKPVWTSFKIVSFSKIFKSLVTVRSLSAETHPIFIIIISKTPYLYLKPSQVQMSGLDEWYLIHVSSSSLFTWNTLIDTDWMASFANQINALRNKDLTHFWIKHFSNYSEPSVNVGRIRPCSIGIHSKILKRQNSSVYTSDTEGWTQ